MNAGFCYGLIGVVVMSGWIVEFCCGLFTILGGVDGICGWNV